MASKGKRYTPEFRRQMVELQRSGRSFEGKRLGKLSITHIFGAHQESNLDISQT
jgi:hypothetical protein